MAVTFEWDESNGVGETVSHARDKCDWKNEDSVTDNYASFPIVAGNNSYGKFINGHFSGAYNELSAGLWSHSVGALDSGITLFGAIAMTADGDRITWEQPHTATTGQMAVLTDMTTAVPTPDRAVWFGQTGPASASKLATQTASLPIYTNYLATQLRTTGAAPAGDLTASLTIALRYDES